MTYRPRRIELISMHPTPEPTARTPDRPAGYAALGFARLAGRLLETLDRLDADALDEEAVHDARVACRRLRVGLQLVRGLVRRRKRLKRLGRDLRALRTALGAARETEVAVITLTRIRPDLSGDVRLAADALAASLAVRHEELRHAIGPALQGLGLPRFRRRLNRVVDELGGAVPEPAAPAEPLSPESDLAETARAAVAAARTRLLELPAAPLAAGDDAALHRLRIEAKKLRYALEFFEPVFRTQVAARLRFLRQLQDQLGDIHDLADLRRRLNDLIAAARRLNDGRVMIGYEALGALVDRHRARRLEGIHRLRAAVAHAGFVPRTRDSAGHGETSGSAAPPGADTRAPSGPADPGAAEPPGSRSADDPSEAAGGRQ